MAGRFGLAARTSLMAVAGSLLLTTAAQALPMTTKTAVPLKAPDYRYMQVAWGAQPGFEAVGYDDSGWATGAAGFGSASGACPWNTPAFVSTPWAPNTDMLLRKRFTLPGSATNLRVDGTIDNDATVYVNGQEIGSVVSGACQANAMSFAAPDSALEDGENLLAVRAHDRGVVTYVDQTVTYDVPVYSVCLLHDPDKPHKSGSTIPLKLQLCDEHGANVSSADIRVHATGLRRLDSTASGDVEDSGSANPDDDFRYDASLGGSGGYIFNKSTKGLGTGTWAVSFTVDGDGQGAYEVPFAVR